MSKPELMQQGLWDDPFSGWNQDFERAIRKEAKLRAYENRFALHEYSEFEAFVVEKLSRRYINNKTMPKTDGGIKAAVRNLGKDYIRRKNRKKRAPLENVDDCEHEVFSNPHDSVLDRAVLDQVFIRYPWLGVVGAAKFAGIPDPQIAEAFEMGKDAFVKRFQKESAEAASLL